ncbi:cytochrome-ba3 oxidase subunit [Natrialbaceae archaeon A-arb3/5]
MLKDVSPRRAAAVGLIALLPTVVYGFGRPGLAGFVAAVNVVIIFGSLYLALSPIDKSHAVDEGTPS